MRSRIRDEPLIYASRRKIWAPAELAAAAEAAAMELRPEEMRQYDSRRSYGCATARHSGLYYPSHKFGEGRRNQL